jgi:hypothetical protein
MDIELLWEELEDIPFDEREDGELILATDWRQFSKGTERTEIWHWFDEVYKTGVASLVNGEYKNSH